MNALPVVAVILAGGVGARVGGEKPKQLLTLAGRPMLDHSIAAFDRSPDVDEVLVVMAPGHVDEARAIVEAGGYRSVCDIVEGGAERSESTRCALAALADDPECIVLFHDAARPFVTAAVIARCVAALRGDHRAVTAAVPSSDTVLTVREGRMTGSLDRSTLARCQTPQGFHRSVIEAAFAAAAQDPDFVATDDATVVSRYLPGEPIAVVDGDERNLKITGPLDLQWGELLAQRPPS